MPDWNTNDNQRTGLASMLGEVGVGRVLGGRYRLVALVGSGSSARVYLADDLSLGRRVAVKCLKSGLTGDFRFLRRFRAEAKAAAQLGHPNILAVYDWGEDSSAAYLVTEVLLGGSLRNMIDGSPRLSPSQGLLVALQVAQALSYAHELGWVHRDIKPANLMFGKDGRLRIADFGIARALAEATWTEPEGVLVGTARYAAPEQASGATIDGKADVYSLALTVVEAVTGQVPLLADSALATMMVRQDRDLAGLDDMGLLGPVLTAAGRADPAARPSAPELIDLLLQAARGLPRPDRMPLVEFRLPSLPERVALIDLRAVRAEPDPDPAGSGATGPDVGTGPTWPGTPQRTGVTGEIPVSGAIRARPRPVPARLGGIRPDNTDPGRRSSGGPPTQPTSTIRTLLGGALHEVGGGVVAGSGGDGPRATGPPTMPTLRLVRTVVSPGRTAVAASGPVAGQAPPADGAPPAGPPVGRLGVLGPADAGASPAPPVDPSRPRVVLGSGDPESEVDEPVTRPRRGRWRR